MITEIRWYFLLSLKNEDFIEIFLEIVNVKIGMFALKKIY